MSKFQNELFIFWLVIKFIFLVNSYNPINTVVLCFRQTHFLTVQTKVQKYQNAFPMDGTPFISFSSRWMSYAWRQTLYVESEVLNHNLFNTTLQERCSRRWYNFQIFLNLSIFHYTTHLTVISIMYDFLRW